MRDMNVHLGVLGERMNRNDEMPSGFTSKTNLENLRGLAEGHVTWSARN